MYVCIGLCQLASVSFTAHHLMNVCCYCSLGAVLPENFGILLHRRPSTNTGPLAAIECRTDRAGAYRTANNSGPIQTTWSALVSISCCSTIIRRYQSSSEEKGGLAPVGPPHMASCPWLHNGAYTRLPRCFYRSTFHRGNCNILDWKMFAWHR